MGIQCLLIKLAKAEEGFSYISKAGGAFLEWLEGKGSPGVNALKGIIKLINLQFGIFLLKRIV